MLVNCRIERTKGKETRIFIPASVGKDQIERISKKLSNDFDIVISAPVENKIGYGSQDSAKGVEITAIRKYRSGSNSSLIEFEDINLALDLIWPENKVNRPVLRGTTDNIVITELHCDEKQNKKVAPKDR